MIEMILAWIASAEAMKLFLTFIFGGGLFTLIKTYFDGKEVETNSKIAKLKVPHEIDSLQVTGLETLSKNLQADNEVLRQERDYYRDGFNELKQQVDDLLDQIRQLKHRIESHESQFLHRNDSGEDN